MKPEFLETLKANQETGLADQIESLLFDVTEKLDENFEQTLEKAVQIRKQVEALVKHPQKNLREAAQQALKFFNKNITPDDLLSNKQFTNFDFTSLDTSLAELHTKTQQADSALSAITQEQNLLTAQEQALVEAHAKLALEQDKNNLLTTTLEEQTAKTHKLAKFQQSHIDSIDAYYKMRSDFYEQNKEFTKAKAQQASEKQFEALRDKLSNFKTMYAQFHKEQQAGDKQQSVRKTYEGEIDFFDAAIRTVNEVALKREKIIAEQMKKIAAEQKASEKFASMSQTEKDTLLIKQLENIVDQRQAVQIIAKKPSAATPTYLGLGEDNREKECEKLAQHIEKAHQARQAQQQSELAKKLQQNIATAKENTYSKQTTTLLAEIKTIRGEITYLGNRIATLDKALAYEEKTQGLWKPGTNSAINLLLNVVSFFSEPKANGLKTFLLKHFANKKIEILVHSKQYRQQQLEGKQKLLDTRQQDLKKLMQDMDDKIAQRNEVIGTLKAETEAMERKTERLYQHKIKPYEIDNEKLKANIDIQHKSQQELQKNYDPNRYKALHQEKQIELQRLEQEWLKNNGNNSSVLEAELAYYEGKLVFSEAVRRVALGIPNRLTSLGYDLTQLSTELASAGTDASKQAEIFKQATLNAFLQRTQQGLANIIITPEAITERAQAKLNQDSELKQLYYKDSPDAFNQKKTELTKQYKEQARKELWQEVEREAQNLYKDYAAGKPFADGTGFEDDLKLLQMYVDLFRNEVMNGLSLVEYQNLDKDGKPIPLSNLKAGENEGFSKQLQSTVNAASHVVYGKLREILDQTSSSAKADTPTTTPTFKR
ncbi:MAG: hypothetical protein Tsb005_06560 [Gammaproteobacteria bacterium]